MRREPKDAELGDLQTAAVPGGVVAGVCLEPLNHGKTTKKHGKNMENVGKKNTENMEKYGKHMEKRI